jgi:hypothetical protein
MLVELYFVPVAHVVVCDIRITRPVGPDDHFEASPIELPLFIYLVFRRS